MRFIVYGRFCDNITISDEELENIKKEIEQDKYYIEADDNTKEDWLRDAINDFAYDKWVKGESQKVDYDIDGIERTD